MQEYHVNSDGVLEYINALEATQKKSKRGTEKNPITDASLLIIVTNTILKMGTFPRTTNRWEDLDKTAQTWDAWKTAYKDAGIKERIHRLATGENAAAHGVLWQATPPFQL